MWLSDLFSGGQVNNASSQVQQTQSAPVNTYAVNRQIQSLTPGQTIQGEVVARNGSEVQIKIADDMVLNARVDQNMQLEVGRTMTFEVRNNGQALTLSPLFANVATDANVLKALTMASLPVNDTTVSLTGMMMEAGLSIDRNSLQQIFREVNAYQGTELSNIVDLHKLGLPVNEQNLTQIASYKNLTHQLVEGMNTVLGTLPETMQGMVQEGNVEGAAQMFRELLDLVKEMPAETAGESGQIQEQPDGSAIQGQAQTVPGAADAPAPAADAGQQVVELTVRTGDQTVGAEAAKTIIAETAEQIADGDTEILLGMAGGDRSLAAADLGKLVGDIPAGLQGAMLAEAEAAPSEKNVIITTGEPVAKESAENADAASRDSDTAVSGRQSLSQELLQTIRANGGDAEPYRALLQQLDTAEQSGDIAQQADVLQRLLQQGAEDKNPLVLRGMLSGKAAQKLLADGLSRLWTIEPKDVADRGKVDELYQRLDRQLKSLNHILERGGQTDSSAYRAVGNMTQNLDFLQQLNQAYTYVQLPLRLQQGDAHGDLYVYTNKRNLAAKDGQISALLHLDMEHLGPVDVYVAMQAEKVNTRFYVQDDDMLDFLEAHMDLLTERLQKRGYNCSVTMQTRGQDEEPESGLNGLMAQEKGHPIAQYAFDMRA